MGRETRVTGRSALVEKRSSTYEYASVIEDGVKGTGEERKDVNSTHEGLGTPEFGALSSKPMVIKAFKHLRRVPGPSRCPYLLKQPPRTGSQTKDPWRRGTVLIELCSGAPILKQVLL